MSFHPANYMPEQFDDGNGNLASGFYIVSFIAGTSTRTNMFADYTGTVAGTKVQLNARGEPEVSGNAITIFLDSDVNYKLGLYDGDPDTTGSSVYTIDNVIDGRFQGGATASTLNFATVSDMVAAGPADGSLVRTEGYNTAGDGAGALYWIDGAFVGGADDKGDHTVSGGSVAVLQGDGYNARLYGAIGDGVTNDTASIQAAIDKCRSDGGGQVFIPAGVYSSSQLILYPKIRFVGESTRMATQLKQVDADGTGVHFILCKPDGGAQISPTVAPYTVIKDLYISGQKGATASIQRDGIHCANANEDPAYTGAQFYRGVHIENCEVTLCTGSGIYIGPERQQSYIQFSRTTFNDERGIYLNSANDCNIGPKCGSGNNGGHSLLVSAGSAPAAFDSQFWESDDSTNHAVFFTLCGWPFISGCIIEGDNDEVMRVDGGYGVSGGILENQPQGAVISNCTFKNSANATGQNGWIQVNNTPNLLLSGVNFAPKDGNTVPNYIIYEQDAVGTQSSVVLQSAFQQSGGPKYYSTAVCNTREVIGGYPLEMRKRVDLGTLSGTATWALGDGNWQYVAGVSAPTVLTIDPIGISDGDYYLLFGANGQNITFVGQTHASDGNSPTESQAVANIRVAGAFVFLTIDNYI